MKHTKKLISLLLILVMALSMSVTAFAAGGTGTITVDNPVTGQEYTAYKIFDVVYNNDKTAYSYTIENAQDSWFADVIAYMGKTWNTESQSYTGNPAEAGDGGIYTGKGITLTPSASDASVYVVGLDETATSADKFSAADFARYLKTCSGHTGERLNASDVGGKTVKQAINLPLGYYFVSSTSGALCNLTTTNPTVTIHDKNDVPFDKTDDKDSVEVGETVNYTIKGKVPDTTGFETYTYKITDTMSDGLTFKKDVAVKIGTTDVTTACTVEYTPTENAATGFTLTIPVMDYQNQVGTEIMVTYSALVNEKAVAKIENNTATLTYSNDPTDDKSFTITPPDKETVYSAKIVIDKYDATNEGEKLAGASFVLYKEESGNESYYHYHEKNVADPNDVAKVEWYTLAEIIDKINENAPSTLDTSATLADVLKLDELVYGGYITVKTTDANGAANFDGLKDGTYQLLETAAPAGYNLLDAPVSVTVQGNDTTEASLTATRQVANKTGSLLPSTGGIGTTIFYVVGSILLVGAAVLLITRKRMNSAK